MTFFAYDQNVVIADKFISLTYDNYACREHVRDTSEFFYSDARKIQTVPIKVKGVVYPFWMMCGIISHVPEIRTFAKTGGDLWDVLHWETINSGSCILNKARMLLVPDDPSEPIMTMERKGVEEPDRFLDVRGQLGAADEYVEYVSRMVPDKDSLTAFERYVVAARGSDCVTHTYDILDRKTGTIKYDQVLTPAIEEMVMRAIERKLRLITKDVTRLFFNEGQVITEINN